jgi:hypothetical protein
MWEVGGAPVPVREDEVCNMPRAVLDRQRLSQHVLATPILVFATTRVRMSPCSRLASSRGCHYRLSPRHPLGKEGIPGCWHQKRRKMPHGTLARCTIQAHHTRFLLCQPSCVKASSLSAMPRSCLVATPT